MASFDPFRKARPQTFPGDMAPERTLDRLRRAPLIARVIVFGAALAAAALVVWLLYVAGLTLGALIA